MDKEEALRLTEKIRLTIEGINDRLDRLAEYAAKAYAGRIWVPLGYGSWQEYVSRELPQLRLARDERRELVVQLAEEGLSTRAIAPVVGAGQMTVVRDLAATEPNDSVDEPRRVVGIDGRTRTYQPRDPEPEQEEDLEALYNQGLTEEERDLTPEEATERWRKANGLPEPDLEARAERGATAVLLALPKLSQARVAIEKTAELAAGVTDPKVNQKLDNQLISIYRTLTKIMQERGIHDA